MANIVIPFAAVSHLPVPTVGFNNNFTEVANKFNTFAVQTDVAKVITVAHTFSVAQNMAGLTMTGDLLFTDALYDIGKTAATRPRDLFLSRNFALGGLVLSDLLFTDNTYDIGKAALTRPRDGFFSRNLSAQGTLIITGQTTLGAALNQNGDVFLNGRLFGTNDASGLRFGINGIGTGWKLDQNMSLVNLLGSGKIIGGTVSLSHRNNADTADNLLISDAGLVTARAGFVATTGGVLVTAGGVTVSAGGLTLTTGTVSVQGNQVLGPRAAGWATQTGAQTRADMGAAPTLAVVASTLDALIMDLRGHGMI